MLTNAIHAIEHVAPPESSHHELMITTEHDDDFVYLYVDDTGCGIAPQAQPMIFEPFFTTKNPGEGTGLGLSIAREIAHEHGGSISVGPREPQGCRATLTLPIMSGVEEISTILEED